MTAIPAQKGGDYLERVSRVFTLTILAVTVVTFLAAPLLALSWSKLPFPGFLVEQTLVVNDFEGQGWSGQLHGIDYPQRLVRVGGQTVRSTAEYEGVIASFDVGQSVSVFTRLPTGEGRLYPSINLTGFPLVDLVRLFWIPCGVGLAYLAIGIWIYRAKGKTRPGRALAFFCFSAATTCTLFFDAATTHVGTVIWIAAFAQLGGALISLSLRFPEEWNSVAARPQLLAVPYLAALLLTGWGIVALASPNPWAYIPSRYVIYLYAVVGALIFLATMLYRARNSSSPTTRRQARVVLLGSSLAFAPLTLWFVATVFEPEFYFDISLLLPSLILFPLTVAIAIFRYRLFEIDAIVNRTVFYGTVTAVLAGIISVSMSLSQRFFLAVTGEKSDLAAVITTLIVVTAFEPIRARVRRFVDKTFKEAPDLTRDLRLLGQEVHSFLLIGNAEQISRRLLDEAARSLQAQSGALSLVTNGQLGQVYTYGPWRGEAWMSVSLDWQGEQYGLLSLGPRAIPRQYTRQECDLLQQVATEVAAAVVWSRSARRLQEAV